MLIPLIAMLFTDEVNWTIFDFVIAVVLLFSSGILCEILLRKTKKRKYRILIIALILIAFLLIWEELAVSIFGSPFSGN